MQLTIDPKAVKWFKEEVGAEKGTAIKFYARYGGSSPIQTGFSLGFTAEETPVNIGVSIEIEGILFYIEESDLWYFDGHDLHVSYNAEMEELEFLYKK